MADAATEVVEEPKKFNYSSISSSFSTSEPGPATTATPAEEAHNAASESKENAARDEKEADALLEELKRSVARKKRFGGDATELEKIIKRAEKFGPDLEAFRKALGRLDKPLVERNSWKRASTGKPYEKKGGAAAAELSEAEKEKLRKRAERFGAK
ncbi:uncharacterized protein V2V93DRAFT_364848 [Kockiozyma suomiensis]|uniref:uncharacterized protein n=1 Tax=Kockiozyma suomiensis TaxID=1337062 RepID=UPI003343AA2F